MSGIDCKNKSQSSSNEEFEIGCDIITDSKSNPDDYQDILSTEDCVLESFKNIEEMKKGC